MMIVKHLQIMSLKVLKHYKNKEGEVLFSPLNFMLIRNVI